MLLVRAASYWGVCVCVCVLFFSGLSLSFSLYNNKVTMIPLILLFIDLFCLSLPSVWGLWWIHLLTWHARQRGFIATASHWPVPDDARDVGRTDQSLVLWATRNDKVKNEAEKMQTIQILNPVNQTIPVQSKKHYFLFLHSSSHNFCFTC